MPPPEIQSAVPETEKEKELAQGVGDLFKRLRQGKASADTLAPAEAVAMPVSSAAAVEAKAPDETQEEDHGLTLMRTANSISTTQRVVPSTSWPASQNLKDLL